MGNILSCHLQLEVLDNLILEQLNPDSSGNCLASENLEQCRSVSKIQKEAIKKAIFQGVLKINKDKRIKCFIQNYQSRLVYLSDCITTYQEAQKLITSDSEYLSVLEYVSAIVVDLLIYINCQFYKYFNPDEKVPQALKEKSRTLFDLKLQEINKIRYPDSDLIHIALSPVYEFQAVDFEKIMTFRKINYLKILLDTVLINCKSLDKSNETLKQQLFYINFNSSRFFRYVVSEIEADIEDEKERNKKIEKLAWHLKQISQTDEKPDLCLKSKQKPIKQQVLNWIVEELSFLEKGRQPIVSGISEISDEFFNNFKITTNFSVPQVAYFLRLLMDTGIISNTNLMDVKKFFSHIVQTRHVETISSGSLHRRYYNIEHGTRKAVKAKIIEILNRINEN